MMSGFNNSRASMENLRDSKDLGPLQKQALSWLRDYGPGTAGEIWNGTPKLIRMKKSDFTSRLNELRDLGLAVSLRDKKCYISQKTCQVWQVMTPEIAMSREYLSKEVERRQHNMDKAQSQYVQAKRALTKAKRTLQLHDTPQGDLFANHEATMEGDAA